MKYIIILLITTMLCYAGKPITINGKPISIFESKAWDRSGNGNDGIIDGNPVLENGYATFDGDGAYNCGSPTELDNFGYADFLISAWAKPTSAINAPIIIARDNGSGAGLFRLFCETDRAFWQITGNPFSQGNIYLTYTGVYTNYTHIAMLRYQSNVVFYVNGVVALETNIVLNSYVNTDTYIGRRQYAITPSYFYGDISQTRIYNGLNGYVGNTNDVIALYNAGRSASKDIISTNGLVAFYDFTRESNPVTIRQ